MERKGTEGKGMERIVMDLSMFMDMININTITYRGIVCIDTFPIELVWGKSDTVLECNNCLTYATFKNVLVGLCINCAKTSYNGKYGKGFYNYPYSDFNNNDISYCFGNIHPLHILNIKGLEYPQNALNSIETYTIYNLSLSSTHELNLLLRIPFNIYGLYELQTYYNCDIEVLHMIIDKIKEHKMTFNIWSSDYYTTCLDIEKFYKVSVEDYKVENIMHDIVVKLKYSCSYCNIYKYKTELKKCGKCYSVRYCSIACQTRDWDTKHKLECESEQDLENPAPKFEYDRQDLENPARKTDYDSSNDGDTSSNDTVETDID